jgi:type IV pilus assembly protein PilP
MVNMIRISIVILMIAVLGFFTGCEDQSETKKPVRAVIISGKILPPPGKTGEKLTPKPKSMGPAKTSQAQTIPKKDAKKTDAKKTVPVPSGDVTQESLKNEQTIVIMQSGKSVTTEGVARYESTGKLNPFLPLIQEKEERAVVGSVVDEKPKRVLTPLEKMELSQIKLVAVILMENRQLAMVEEATGKGYEVNIGTYMGKNNGQVSKINQSSIVVKEYVKDYKGKLQARFQEIKLQKKEGGE